MFVRSKRRLADERYWSVVENDGRVVQRQVL